MAAVALDQGPDCAGSLAEDQVAFPMAGRRPVGRLGRSLADVDDVAQLASVNCRGLVLVETLAVGFRPRRPVPVDGSRWPRAQRVGGCRFGRGVGGGLPVDVGEVASSTSSRVPQLAADAQRGASWYQRARTGGLVHLDLTQSEQLDLLRRYGPFTTDASVWVHGDPTPVIETGDSFGDLPRFTYRLDQAELDHVRALLSEVGLTSSTLVPRRLRATRT